MRLHPVRLPVAGPLIYPIDRAAAVLRQVLELTADAPDTFAWAAVLTTAPAGAPLPDSVRGRPALLLPVFSATAASDPVLTALRRATRPVADLAAPVPLSVFHKANDAAAPEGAFWDVRSEWLSGLDQAALDDAVAMIQAAGSPLSEVLLRPLGGVIAARGAPDTPFAYRSAAFLLEVIAHWPAGDGAAERGWMVRAWSALRRLSAGGPDINHLGLDEGPDRARAAYRPEILARLAEVRRAYDPDGIWMSCLRIGPDDPTFATGA
jgi:hypothetical protein